MRRRFLQTLRFTCPAAGLLLACAEVAPTVQTERPVPISTWAKAIDSLPGTYTLLASASEFWDSVLVTTDGREGLVWRSELVAGTRELLGSKGNGPGEFLSAGVAVKVSHDSVALLNMQRTGFPVLHVATGRGRTHQVAGAAPRAIGSQNFGAPVLTRADTLGHVYGAPLFAALVFDPRSGRRISRTLQRLASIPIVRYSLRTLRTDTLYRFPRGVSETPTTRDADGTRRGGMELDRYGAYNDWLVTADGKLIVADASKYSLLVLDATGRDTTRRVLQLPTTPIPVSPTAWKAHVQQATRGSNALITGINARVFSKIGKAPPAAPQIQFDVPPMPRELPPVSFRDGKRHMHESGGVLWVPVNKKDGSAREYWDLVDLVLGTRLTTLELPEKQYLVTVTANGAYVLVSDEDDLQRLLLYRPTTMRPKP